MRNAQFIHVPASVPFRQATPICAGVARGGFLPFVGYIPFNQVLVILICHPSTVEIINDLDNFLYSDIPFTHSNLKERAAKYLELFFG